MPDDPDDWGGAPDPETGYAVVATGIRAHLSAPGGLRPPAARRAVASPSAVPAASPTRAPIEDNMRIARRGHRPRVPGDWSMSRDRSDGPRDGGGLPHQGTS